MNISIETFDSITNMEKEKQAMKEANRQDFTTWPKIFFNGKFIGGYNDLKNFLKKVN